MMLYARHCPSVFLSTFFLFFFLLYFYDMTRAQEVLPNSSPQHVKRSQDRDGGKKHVQQRPTPPPFEAELPEKKKKNTQLIARKKLTGSTPPQPNSNGENFELTPSRGCLVSSTSLLEKEAETNAKNAHFSDVINPTQPNPTLGFIF